jgi:hypothetical protein
VYSIPILLQLNIVIVLQLNIVIVLQLNVVIVLVDTGVHSVHGKVIRCHFKPKSVERSIDLYQRGYTSAGNNSKSGYQ